MEPLDGVQETQGLRNTVVEIQQNPSLHMVIDGKVTLSIGICSTAVITGLLSQALKLLSMM